MIFQDPLSPIQAHSFLLDISNVLSESIKFFVLDLIQLQLRTSEFKSMHIRCYFEFKITLKGCNIEEDIRL